MKCFRPSRYLLGMLLSRCTGSERPGDRAGFSATRPRINDAWPHADRSAQRASPIGWSAC